MNKVIGQKINPSIETRKQILIDELQLLGVHKGPRGEQLQKMDYYSLRSMLASKMAVRG